MASPSRKSTGIPPNRTRRQPTSTKSSEPCSCLSQVEPFEKDCRPPKRPATRQLKTQLEQQMKFLQICPRRKRNAAKNLAKLRIVELAERVQRCGRQARARQAIDN